MDGSLATIFFFFFFNDTATTEIYTLSLHDALPIWNGPTRVRTSVARCAPHPNSSPTSRARPRRYVPPLTVARNATSGGAKRTSSSAETRTGRAANATGSPRREIGRAHV